MIMITTKEVDNPPRFHVGELVAGYKNDKIVVAHIENINKFSYSQDYIEGQKKQELDSHRNSCGRGALPIYRHHYQYSTEVGVLFEHDIKASGTGSVNEFLCRKLAESEERAESLADKLNRIYDII